MKRTDAKKLPPLGVELALMAMMWQVQREMFGMAFCHDTGIGALRRRFGPLARGKPKHPGEQVRHEARAILATMCANCPFEDCPMKQWGIA